MDPKIDNLHAYSPFSPPFHYDEDEQVLFDSQENRVADIRGFGFLIKPSGPALPVDTAGKIQDRIGRRIAEIMNEDAELPLLPLPPPLEDTDQEESPKEIDPEADAQADADPEPEPEPEEY